MIDFANLNNSSGSFPDVIGVDASGPGEVDGTELTADLFNDLMGAFQAILNDQGLTPSGSAESGSGTSQILNALKMMMANQNAQIPMSDGITEDTTDWYYNIVIGGASGSGWVSATNSQPMEFPLRPPYGVTCDYTATVNIQPGAARASGSRMTVGVYRQTEDSVPVLLSSLVEDDGTATNQDVVVSFSSHAFSSTYRYFIIVTSGNTGAASVDVVNSISQLYD